MKKNIITVAVGVLLTGTFMFSPLVAAEAITTDNAAQPETIEVPPVQLARADTQADNPAMAILPESPQATSVPSASSKNVQEQDQMAIIPGTPAAEEAPPALKPAPPEEPGVAVQPPQGTQSKNKISVGNPSAYLQVDEPDEQRYHGRLKYRPGHFRVYHYLPEANRSVGTEVLLSEMSREVAGKVYYGLKDDGEKHHTARVAIVGAVPLSDLKRETEFGRITAEYLLTDLADRGIKVSELRLGREINILAQTGEFILSRNISELANKDQPLDYVVVSTFSNTRKTLILQGRLVSLKDGIIKSSWRYTMPLNRELLGLFHTIEKPYTIAVRGMTD